MARTRARKAGIEKIVLGLVARDGYRVTAKKEDIGMDTLTFEELGEARLQEGTPLRVAGSPESTR